MTFKIGPQPTYYFSHNWLYWDLGIWNVRVPFPPSSITRSRWEMVPSQNFRMNIRNLGHVELCVGSAQYLSASRVQFASQLFAWQSSKWSVSNQASNRNCVNWSDFLNFLNCASTFLQPKVQNSIKIVCLRAQMHSVYWPLRDFGKYSNWLN